MILEFSIYLELMGMAKTKLGNSLVGGFGAAGGSLVLSTPIQHLIRGIPLEIFLALEICGIFFIAIAVYIHFKY